MKTSYAYHLAGSGMTKSIAAINRLNLGAEEAEKLFETIAKEIALLSNSSFSDGVREGYSNGWDDAAEMFR